MDQPKTEIPLPRWKSHKEVSAAKIVDIRYDSEKEPEPDTNGGALLVLEVGAGVAFAEVSPEFMDKHAPRIGGYFVVYEDGYRSFSPAKAFEEGYVRI